MRNAERSMRSGMQRLFSRTAFLGLAALMAAAGPVRGERLHRVNLTDRPDMGRVDVTIGGRPFTSWWYTETQMKPILYPLRTARGTVITRRYPLEVRAGERTDHRHHSGAWFNHGSVNGVDFWNNGGSPAMGRVVQTAMTLDRASGAIRASLNWLMPDGSVVLTESSIVRFSGASRVRIIDRHITLTAGDKRVVFGETKNGAFGIRVARELEEPMEKAAILTGDRGEPSATPLLDRQGTGVYQSSEGRKGEKGVWGTRAGWASLSGTAEGESVTIAIFDHPSNPTYPTWWHTRGYGLFAANPFGGRDFGDPAASEYALQPGESLKLSFRILIHTGKLDASGIQAFYRSYSSTGFPKPQRRP